jgi:energy-converting hydrogenase Eha subunit E
MDENTNAPPDAPKTSAPTTTTESPDTGATNVPGPRGPLLLFLACAFALLGIGVSIVHLTWPSPLMFTLFMSVGQGSFALGMLLYAVVILRDLKKRRVL